jgi:hypothetical protein
VCQKKEDYEMQQVNGYQRTVSSGMVFERKMPIKNELENAVQRKKILLCLIEDEIELSIRSQGCLNNAGIKLIGQLVQKSASELLKLRNFGRTSLREIEKSLSEIGFTLEMALTFYPWNGSGNGDELIQILALQTPGGGFLIDNKFAEKLGIELMEMNQDTSRKKQSLLHTKYLLDRLELKFEKDMPYLTDLLKPHRKWLAKELR